MTVTAADRVLAAECAKHSTCLKQTILMPCSNHLPSNKTNNDSNLVPCTV